MNGAKKKPPPAKTKAVFAWVRVPIIGSSTNILESLAPGIVRLVSFRTVMALRWRICINQ